MGLIVNTNIASMNAQRMLNTNTKGLEHSFEKLSSGLRINRAADDAAGLSISENMRTQTRGMAQAINNAEDGVNLLQVAEGGLSVITDNLQRIRELTVQAANDTNSSTERTAIASEVDQRLKDITRIAGSLKFNNINLLDGTATTTTLQIGANSAAATNALTVGGVLKDSAASALGFTMSSITASGTGAYASGGNIRTFLDTIDSALSTVFTRRSEIGALQNRLSSTIESLSITKENLSSSESRIRDLDIASETARMTRNQILQQSSLSILTQANQAPQMALRLLG